MQNAATGRNEEAARALVAGIVFAVPALLCVHGAASSVVDPDVGWHLKTAQWIVAHRGFPHSDPFSRVTAGAPWQAYSWLFDVLLLKLYQWLNLGGMLAYTAAMAAAITAAVYRLASRGQTDAMKSVLLTGAAVVCLLRDFTPRPWLFTMLFFAVELDLLLEYRRTRNARTLLWLLPMFALWANLHIQFIDGLLVLGLAACEPLLARWTGWGEGGREARALWLALAGCVGATLINPYGLTIYRAAWVLGSQSGVLETVNEMHALSFRSFPDFLLLFLLLAATAMLFRRGRPEPFEVLLLGVSAVLSFRSQRDAWIVTMAATAILAAELAKGSEEPQRMPAWTLAVTLGSMAAALAAGALAIGMNNARLRAFQAQELPVQAAEVVKDRHYAGPVFNDYNWGGYLMWKLDEPVSIDGRAGLYGDRNIEESMRTWAGGPEWAEDPELETAGVVIAPEGAALTQLLRLDGQFQMVYEDKVAAVFVARKSEAGGTSMAAMQAPGNGGEGQR